MKSVPAASLVILIGSVGCGPSVATIQVDPSSLVLTEKGRTTPLKADPKDSEGKTVIEAVLKVQWSSSAPEIAVVNNGVVSAVKSGNAKILATVGSVSGSAEVVVSIPAKLTLEPAKSDVLGVDKQVKLNAAVFDEIGRPIANQPIVWSTGDPDVANVSEGTVTTAGAGTTTIKAALGALSASATIAVTLPAAEKVTIEPATVNLGKAGEAIRLKAIASDAQGQEIKGTTAEWASSDEKVATVSETGQVQAIKKGKARIKATVGAKSAEIDVVVQK